MIFDVIIVGSGAAGLSAALWLAPTQKVVVLSKNTLQTGASYAAQGGIAAVLSEEDSFAAHQADTLACGAGLSDVKTVEWVIQHAPETIEWLKTLGVLFTTQPSDALHLTQEGGHTHRRIVHAMDATGKAVHNALLKQAQKHPNITFLSHHMAVDLIIEHKKNPTQQRCVGVYALDIQTNTVKTYRSRCVILATGGASKVYLYTTNPDVASGDGIAMAWRAGCSVQNMEFNQFHPTCLYHASARSLLLTEAIRGEGGYLTLPNGERFMHRFDERGELASRDIVARAIDHEMKRLGLDCVYLDISHKPAEFIKMQFPTLYKTCLDYGFDMTREPLPIVPAAHYTCGGVKTDVWGTTDIPHLYAIGETACTGLHGANRLASNSLLECFVLAKQASLHILKHIHTIPPVPTAPEWDESQVSDPDERVVISHNWEELRRFMWDYVGIVRSTKRLLRAQNRIALLKQEIQDFYAHFRVNPDLLELRNLVTVADLIVESALRRKESRGLHFIVDYPDLLEKAEHTILVPS
jgi:L-aspartate oxidase